MTYAVTGAQCEVNPDSDDCYLDADQRTRLIGLVRERIRDAGVEYFSAIQELKIEHLIKKESDLHWAVALVIDIASSRLTSAVENAAGKLRKSAINSIDNVALERAAHGMMNERAPIFGAQRALRGIDENKTKTAAKAVVDPAKKSVQRTATATQNAPERTQKGETQSYLGQLRSNVVIAFKLLADSVAARASDSELMAMFDAFDPSEHNYDAYKQALAEKLERFEKCGVTSIGRTQSYYKDQETPTIDTHRDTRVVWVGFASGRPSELWYEYHDGHPGNLNVIKPGDPLDPVYRGPMPFGPRDPIYKDPKLDRPVPQEFWLVAVERHIKTWSEAPGSRMIDDSWYMPRHSSAPTGPAAVGAGGRGTDGAQPRAKREAPALDSDHASVLHAMWFGGD
ncbi:MAG: hypothetical protein ACTHU0_10295 [Kofleriaceae bacterium]